MDKQNITTPTIDQMRHLQSLGINCDDASMIYHPISSHSEIFKLQVLDIEHTREFWADERPDAPLAIARNKLR